MRVAILLMQVGFAIPKKMAFNQKNSSMLCIGVNKIKIHFDISQLCCGVVHLCSKKKRPADRTQTVLFT